MKAPATILLAAILTTASAQQPKINRIPPQGIEVPAADRTEIEAGLKQLAGEIAKLRLLGAKDAKIAIELPNVEIFHKSADWALRYDEVFDVKQIAVAKDHVQQGLARAAALAKGETPWNTATGLVVRGYRSTIDGSVQPYGVLVPESWAQPDRRTRKPFPLHFWCHGRGEKLSELSFIEGSAKNKGEFTPEESIVCFLYGRFCNANKFAGEVDLFEAKADIVAHYPIDKQRVVVRGFSMGGAACWQFATHFADQWAAVAPGAGFAETAEFFRVFAEGKEAPPWWEQVLWRWYDCTTMAANLSNTSTVAYSGEIDGQKQAADIMVKYAAQEGITFPHIIGPQTPHKYHPDSKPEINKLVDAAVAAGNTVMPEKVRFSTYSLIYPRMEWVTVTGMEHQWERADVTAERKDGRITVTTKNVTGLTLALPMLPGANPPSAVTSALIDGTPFVAARHGQFIEAHKENGKWTAGPALDPIGHKHPGVCGPIDHAFMSRFVFVRPTGSPLNAAVGAWTKSEMEHAIASWRQVFRGDAEIVDDTALTADQIKNANLVLWGDPSSNKVFNTLSTLGYREGGHSGDPMSLPLRWSEKTLELKGQKFDPANHVPILIFPNPLNPRRYIVLNSGPTFRETASLNNSDQTPKLPDWAIVDLRTPPGPKWPGQIVDAGFFDEGWK